MGWAPDYVTLPEAKAYLKIADSDDDAQLAFAISAASRAIDKLCGRQFGRVDTPESRTYTGRYDRRRRVYVFEIDDLPATDDLVVLSGTDEITDYVLEPANAIAKGAVYTQLLTALANEITATERWGWLAFPSAVKLATHLQTARFHARRDSPYGVAGSPEDGSELRLLAAVDPDVAVSLRPYWRNWWAA